MRCGHVRCHVVLLLAVSFTGGLCASEASVALARLAILAAIVALVAAHGDFFDALPACPCIWSMTSLSEPPTFDKTKRAPKRQWKRNSLGRRSAQRELHNDKTSTALW
jgi:hypothetical protein